MMGTITGCLLLGEYLEITRNLLFLEKIRESKIYRGKIITNGDCVSVKHALFVSIFEGNLDVKLTLGLSLGHQVLSMFSCVTGVDGASHHAP